MDSWTAEPALVQLALDVWGPERLDAWLREQYAQHDQMRSLAGLISTRSWPVIDGGPLLDRLCGCLGGPLALPTDRISGRSLAFYYIVQRLLFIGLLQALPIEALSEPLRELRLSVDIGV